MNIKPSLDSEFKDVIQQLTYIVDHETWNQNRWDEKFHRKLAKELTGKDVDPKVYLVGTKTLYQIIVEVNDKFNSPYRSSGAKSFRSRVIDIQGGEFCAFCGDGRVNSLHVDHIHPVASGGEHHLSNMQLLCEACNTAKKDNKFNGIESIFGWTNGRKVSASLRYRIFLESLVVVAGRKFGSCVCSRTANQVKLVVVVINASIAANYGNLHVQCISCNN